jgi:hypothetical protein
MSSKDPKTKQKRLQDRYQASVNSHKAYEHALEARLKSEEYRKAPKVLAAALKDLQRRGLLQYEGNRYDIHPVVRAVAAGLLNSEETQRNGQRIVDALSARPHSPWEGAKTLEDIQDGVHVVRTWLRMGRYKEAYDAYCGDLSYTLLLNLEAYRKSWPCFVHFSPMAGRICPSMSRNSPVYTF